MPQCWGLKQTSDFFSKQIATFILAIRHRTETRKLGRCQPKMPCPNCFTRDSFIQDLVFLGLYAFYSLLEYVSLPIILRLILILILTLILSLAIRAWDPNFNLPRFNDLPQVLDLALYFYIPFILALATIRSIRFLIPSISPSLGLILVATIYLAFLAWYPNSNPNPSPNPNPNPSTEPKP